LLGSIGGSSIAAVIGHFALDRAPSDAAIINIMIYACIAGGVYVAAVIVQQWQLIRSQLLQEKENTAEEHSKRVTIEEKARIARELHDIVAHSMSIINIQASSAPVRHAGLDVEVAKEFEDISTSARAALTEMRGLLSVLRNDDSTHELAPQPKLSDVETLVDKTRQAGVRVTFERSGEAIDAGLRESIGLAGYRIVQEALSNAIRHARNSDIAIRIRSGGGTAREIAAGRTPIRPRGADHRDRARRQARIRNRGQPGRGHGPDPGANHRRGRAPRAPPERIAPRAGAGGLAQTDRIGRRRD